MAGELGCAGAAVPLVARSASCGAQAAGLLHGYVTLALNFTLE